MKEINEEIKLTIEMMQSDMDDSAHSELQSHLCSLLEMKRERLSDKVFVVNQMLSSEDLKRGGWWCGDVSEECAIAFNAKGLIVFNWKKWGYDCQYECCLINNTGNVSRATIRSLPYGLRQIKLINGEFYYC